MYPLIGNHEGVPCDEFDIYSDHDQWLLNSYTEIWGEWFTEECNNFLMNSQKTI